MNDFTLDQWNAVDSLVDAFRPTLQVSGAQLRERFTASRRILHPLDDPLLVDLGAHRWLSSAREESYSDWLAWIVGSMPSGALLDLLGISDGTIASLDLQVRPQVRREVVIDYGHPDHEGRLDIVIRYPREAIIVVEVKVTSADSADTEKHDGYGRWLASQSEPSAHKHSILLVTEARADSYDGFVVRRWDAVCAGLRRDNPRVQRDHGLVVAALNLAFAGAVEQNLLGFSAPLAQRIFRGEVVAGNPLALIRHLESARGAEGASNA